MSGGRRTAASDLAYFAGVLLPMGVVNAAALTRTSIARLWS